MKDNFWNNWARIAIEHEREAATCRAKAVEEWGTGKSSGVMAEMHASMVAIVAVALAIDSLHADVAPLIGRAADRRNRGGRHWGWMLETFREAFPDATRWQRDLEWLFSLRDQAVHFRGQFEDPVPHPELPTNVSPQVVAFSTESASRAVSVLLTILDTVLAGPATAPPVEAWGRERLHVLAELRDIRDREPSNL
jgi:hypothetical protein